MSGPDLGFLHLGLTRRAAAAGLTAAAFAGCGAGIAAPDDAALGQRFVIFDPPVPMSPVALLDRRGRSVVLTARPGRIRLIGLWASWCVACHREVPELAAARQSLERAGIDVAIVNVETPASASGPSAAISTGSLASFYDPDGTRLAAPSPNGRRSPFHLFGMPILFVIDRTGLVRGYIKGVMDWTNPAVIVFIHGIGDGMAPEL